MCASPAFPRGGALLLNQSLPVNMRLVRGCRISAFVLSALVLLAGLIALAGWTFALPALTTFGARGVAMNPLTAACFIFLAGALLLLLPGADPDTERWTARALATVAIFHYTSSEILGRKVDELIAPRDDEGETASFTSRGSAGENLHRATVRRRRDGELISVEVFVVPLTLRGRPAGTYGLYRDLTGQRRPS
jgi:PAS domain S-box-containing protein